MQSLRHVTSTLLSILCAGCDISGTDNLQDQSPIGIPTAVKPVSIERKLRPNLASERPSVYWDVVGRFAYEEASDGIVADGWGGACLVVQTTKFCNAQKDCNSVAPADGAGYCVSASDQVVEDGPTPGRCWIHGGYENYCNVAMANWITAWMKEHPGEVPNPLDADPAYALKLTPKTSKPYALAYSAPAAAPQKALHLSLPPGRKAAVRLITCLNPPKSTWEDGPPCRGGKAHGLQPQVRVGEAVTIP